MKASPDPEALVLNQRILGPLKPSFLSHQIWGARKIEDAPHLPQSADVGLCGERGATHPPPVWRMWWHEGNKSRGNRKTPWMAESIGKEGNCFVPESNRRVYGLHFRATMYYSVTVWGFKH
jgi:hypothetical protein